MTKYLRLVRFPNLLIVALTQYLMRWCIIYPIIREFAFECQVHQKIEVYHFDFQFSELNFFFLVLATVCLTAAGYVINDYFDRRTDMLNRPQSVIIDKQINRRFAVLFHIALNVIGCLLGIYVTWRIGFIKLGIVFPVIAGLLWYYSTTYKRQFLIGNIIVAFLTALVPLIIAVCEFVALNSAYRTIITEHQFNFNLLFYWILGFSYFAFITTLIREIIKDVEDFEGDTELGRNTVPIVLGIFYTKVIVISLSLITISSLLLSYFIFLNDKITLFYFIFALFLPFIFGIYKIVKADKKEDYHFISIYLKILMLVGLLYSLIVAYNFLF